MRNLTTDNPSFNIKTPTQNASKLKLQEGREKGKPRRPPYDPNKEETSKRIGSGSQIGERFPVKQSASASEATVDPVNLIDIKSIKKGNKYTVPADLKQPVKITNTAENRRHLINASVAYRNKPTAPNSFVEQRARREEIGVPDKPSANSTKAFQTFREASNKPINVPFSAHQDGSMKNKQEPTGMTEASTVNNDLRNTQQSLEQEAQTLKKDDPSEKHHLSQTTSETQDEINERFRRHYNVPAIGNALYGAAMLYTSPMRQADAMQGYLLVKDTASLILPSFSQRAAVHNRKKFLYETRNGRLPELEDSLRQSGILGKNQSVALFNDRDVEKFNKLIDQYFYKRGNLTSPVSSYSTREIKKILKDKQGILSADDKKYLEFLKDLKQKSGGVNPVYQKHKRFGRTKRMMVRAFGQADAYYGYVVMQRSLKAVSKIAYNTARFATKGTARTGKFIAKKATKGAQAAYRFYDKQLHKAKPGSKVYNYRFGRDRRKMQRQNCYHRNKDKFLDSRIGKGVRRLGGGIGETVNGALRVPGIVGGKRKAVLKSRPAEALRKVRSIVMKPFQIIGDIAAAIQKLLFRLVVIIAGAVLIMSLIGAAVHPVLITADSITGFFTRSSKSDDLDDDYEIYLDDEANIDPADSMTGRAVSYIEGLRADFYNDIYREIARKKPSRHNITSYDKVFMRSTDGIDMVETNVTYSSDSEQRFVNTKEIATMASMYFDMITESRKVTERQYLRYCKDLFEASHTYVLEESPVYYCGHNCTYKEHEYCEGSCKYNWSYGPDDDFERPCYGHPVYYCPGHMNLYCTVTVIKATEDPLNPAKPTLFDLDKYTSTEPDPRDVELTWYDCRQEALDLMNQDWFTEYGFHIDTGYQSPVLEETDTTTGDSGDSSQTPPWYQSQ